MQPLKDVAGDLKRGADEKQPAPGPRRPGARHRPDTEAARGRSRPARRRRRARKELPRDADAALAAAPRSALRANAG